MRCPATHDYAIGLKFCRCDLEEGHAGCHSHTESEAFGRQTIRWNDPEVLPAEESC